MQPYSRGLTRKGDKRMNCIPCFRQGFLKTIPYPVAHPSASYKNEPTFLGFVGELCHVYSEVLAKQFSTAEAWFSLEPSHLNVAYFFIKIRFQAECKFVAINSCQLGSWKAVQPRLAIWWLSCFATSAVCKFCFSASVGSRTVLFGQVVWMNEWCVNG